MLKINISNLKPGVKLGKDIYTYDGQLLLSKGIVINREHLDSFARRSISEVYLIEVAPRMKAEKKFEDIFSETLHLIKTTILELKLGEEVHFEELIKAIDELLELVYDETDLFRQMRRMKELDEYLYTHSINVALLAILIGRWMKYDKSILKELGLAGILHDIGKVFISEDILNKPGKLSEEEFEEVKKHSLYAYNILSEQENISNNVANAVLHHHEKSDGSGYPMGIKMTQSNFYASVIAVADVFDALTSNRSYCNKFSPYKAVEILWEESFGKLDPKVAKVFYDKITNFYVGNEVLLSNNERGVVVYIEPSQPTRPVVMVGEDFYFLSTDRSIDIIEILD